MHRTPAVIALFLCVACYSGGTALEGLAPVNPEDEGPRIRWDLFARPLPDLPYPNDVGTRTDLTSPTGRRINITDDAPTEHEARLRRMIAQLDGFSTYGPVWLKLEGRVDLEYLHRVQTDGDPNNDAIYLFDIDPDSPHFGERVAIELGAGPDDLGKTRFPLGHERPGQYFANDPRAQGSNLLFETFAEDIDEDGHCDVEEDLNLDGVLDPSEDTDGDGRLDPHEDTDNDGICDVPNTWGELLGDDYARLEEAERILLPIYASQGGEYGPPEQRLRQYMDLITFYEMETDTLMFRPVVPLEQTTTYAAVLTRQIRGMENQSPIRSPFEWINHLQQTDALGPLVHDGLLADFELDTSDVAFAWSFTTQSISRDVEAVRAGLYGVGTLANLAREFPAEVTEVYRVENDSELDGLDSGVPEGSNLHVLKASRLVGALQDPLISENLGFDEASLEPLFRSYEDYVSHFVFFTIDTPALVSGDRPFFELDVRSGQAVYDHETVHVTCAVPKTRGGHKPPFPVVFYSHGYTSSRYESLGFAGSLARFGLATCAIDAYGHGLALPDIFISVVEALLEENSLQRLANLCPKGDACPGLLFLGRARDLNGDGVADSGGDFWSANMFHTRDVVRQSMIDYIQTVRVMRSFGSGTMPVDVDGDGEEEVSGDFDGDGVPDMGAGQPFSIFGQSLGGIMSALVAPAEPAIVASAPTAGSGGLIAVALRTVQGGVVQAAFLPFFGPLIVGEPSGVAGRTDIKLDILDVNSEEKLKIASVPDPDVDPDNHLENGDVVEVLNLDNGETDRAVLYGPEPGRFRLQIAADFGDRVELRFYRRGQTTPYRTISTFEEPVEGFMGENYFEGDPLRVLQEGFGHARQSVSARRLFGVAQMVVDPADPINWARAYAEPFDLRPDGRVPTNLLVVNTVGDMNVPVDTGIAIARAAGHIDQDFDERYGTSTDQVLLDNWVVEGLEHLHRFALDPCHYTSDRILFDVDDTSQGLADVESPRLNHIVANPACGELDAAGNPPAWCRPDCMPAPPLRATVTHPWGTSGMRIPYVSPRGKHGFEVPDPTAEFDYNLFQINQIGWYFATRGHELLDEPCMASLTEPCDFY